MSTATDPGTDTDSAEGRATAAGASQTTSAGDRCRRRHRHLHHLLGDPPADHRVEERQSDPPRRVRQRPWPVADRVLHDHAGGAGVGPGLMFANRMKNWERGAPRSAAHDEEERQAADQGLPRRRVHADPAARCRRRVDALDDLLLVPRAARRDDRARDRPPGPRVAEVPPRHHVQGVFVRRRLRRADLHDRRHVGDRPPLRAASVPHPHQVEARACGDPGHVVRRRPHRLRRRDVPHRRRGPAELRELVVHRLPPGRLGRHLGRRPA